MERDEEARVLLKIVHTETPGKSIGCILVFHWRTRPSACFYKTVAMCVTIKRTCVYVCGPFLSPIASWFSPIYRIQPAGLPTFPLIVADLINFAASPLYIHFYKAPEGSSIIECCVSDAGKKEKWSNRSRVDSSMTP